MSIMSGTGIDRNRPNTFARDYVKIWWKRFHFIFDNRNRWIVLGFRTTSAKRYIYKQLGPLNLIVSGTSVRPGDKEWDVWFRLFYGRQRSAEERKKRYAKNTPQKLD